MVQNGAYSDQGPGTGHGQTAGRGSGLESGYLAFLKSLHQAMVGLSRQPGGGREVDRLFDAVRMLMERAFSAQRLIECAFSADRMMINGRELSASATREPYVQWLIKRCNGFGVLQLNFDPRAKVGDIRKLAQVFIYIQRHGTQRFSARQMLINKGTRGIEANPKGSKPLAVPHPAPSLRPRTQDPIPQNLPVNPIPPAEGEQFQSAIDAMVKGSQWPVVGEVLKNICLDLSHSDRHNRVLAVSAGYLLCRTIRDNRQEALLHKVHTTFANYLEQALDPQLKVYYQSLMAKGH